MATSLALCYKSQKLADTWVQIRVPKRDWAESACASDLGNSRVQRYAQKCGRAESACGTKLGDSKVQGHIPDRSKAESADAGAAGYIQPTCSISPVPEVVGSLSPATPSLVPVRLSSHSSTPASPSCSSSLSATIPCSTVSRVQCDSMMVPFKPESVEPAPEAINNVDVSLAALMRAGGSSESTSGLVPDRNGGPKSESCFLPLPPSDIHQLPPTAPPSSTSPSCSTPSPPSPQPPSTPPCLKAVSLSVATPSHTSPVPLKITPDPIASPQPCSSPQCSTPISLSPKSTDVYDVVDEFPAHKIAFFVASEYFQAFMEWEDPSVIYLDVHEDQVAAAQALVYFLYHGSLQKDLPTADVAQLLILMDQYQVASGIQACGEQLVACMEGGKDVEALLHVCRLLSHLGSPSPTTQCLYSFFSQEQERVREALSKFATEGEQDGAYQQVFHWNTGNTGCRRGLQKLVDVLREMFQDFDHVWMQEEFRTILRLFPVEAVKDLLSWDDLCPMSENVVVSAIHHYLLAQPTEARAEAAEQLLSTVRVPFLSPSYLSQVLPSFPWVRECEQGDHLVRIGTQAALAGTEAHQWLFSCLPRELAHLSRPRRYQAACYRADNNTEDMDGGHEVGNSRVRVGSVDMNSNRYPSDDWSTQRMTGGHATSSTIARYTELDGGCTACSTAGGHVELVGQANDELHGGREGYPRLQHSQTPRQNHGQGCGLAASRKLLSKSFPEATVGRISKTTSRSCQWPTVRESDAMSQMAAKPQVPRRLDWSEQQKSILEWSVSWQAIIEAQQAAQAAGTRVTASQGTHTVSGPHMWVNGVCIGVELSFYLPLSSASATHTPAMPQLLPSSQAKGDANCVGLLGLPASMQLPSSSSLGSEVSASDGNNGRGIVSERVLTHDHTGAVQERGVMGQGDSSAASSAVGSANRRSASGSWIERALDLMAGREPSLLEDDAADFAGSSDANASSSSSSQASYSHSQYNVGRDSIEREGAQEGIASNHRRRAAAGLQQPGGVVSFKWFWNMGLSGNGNKKDWDDGDEVVLGWQLSSPRVLVSYEMELNGAGATVGRVLPANNIRRGKTCVARNEKSFACILAFQCPENMEELAERGESLQLVLKASVW